MLGKSFYSFVFRSLLPAFFLLFPFLSPECGRAQVIKMPKPIPDIVKEYKSMELHGGQMSMMDTGVRVNGGDYLTVLADGVISRGPNRLSPIGATAGLIFKIGGGSRRYLDQVEGFRVEEGGNLLLKLFLWRIPRPCQRSSQNVWWTEVFSPLISLSGRSMTRSWYPVSWRKQA